MSNVSFTIHTPLQRTLHPTGPTIPDTYCISTLACNINPTNPQNIIQKFAPQFFGTDTSTAIDQCGILCISSLALYTTSHYSNWLCPILCNWFTHMFQLDELSPSHWPNPPPPTGHTTDDSLVGENIVWTLFAVGLKSTMHGNGSRKPLDFNKPWACWGFSYM